MVLLHIADVKNPNGNGVVVAINNYVKYEKNKCNVAIYNLGNDIKNVIDENITVFSFDKNHSISSLTFPYNKPDLVVFNEVYKPKYLKLYKECINNNIPYVIIPHGCLIKAAQNKKWLKKKIANLLLFNQFINKSVAIQYLNENERDNSVIKKHKYIISGNGIDIVKKQNKYTNNNFVFIGRYDVKVKGLDLLVKTVLSYRDWFLENNVKVFLYGRTSGSGYDELKQMISNYNLSDILILNGPVYGVEKEKILLNSYAFIQVSRHEGQPIGIMEALSYGLPCILTYGTSFGTYVNKNKCGIGINFNEQELFSAIKKMYENKKFRDECSKNSKVIQQDFEWHKVIDDCLEEYVRVL